MKSIKQDDKVAYYHEDEYLMIELLPLNKYNYYKNLVDNDEERIIDINQLSEEELNELDKPANNLGELKIELSTFIKGLDKSIPFYNRVQTGYSSYYENCDNVIAFGHQHYLVFVSFDAGNYIENIWIHNSVEEDCDVFQADYLRKFISSKGSFICLDWYMGKYLYDYSNQGEFIDYMHSVAKRIKAAKRLFQGE